MAERLRLWRDGGVVTIRLEHPPLNTFDTAMRRALTDAAGEITEDETARAVVLTGGERVFAAGGDIDQLATMDYEAVVGWNRAMQHAVRGFARLPVPVIAAVNGYALGGGMELALAADYRIVSSGATLSQPEVLLGIIPGSGGTQRLCRLVGPARAKELLMSGRHVEASESLRLGLVEQVVDGDAYPAALAYARKLAAGPRFAIQAIKEAVDHGGDAPMETGLALERSLIAGLFATQDRTTGMQSFLTEGPGTAEFT
jgi:enoyl-CoA hydratase/carnithine racemase